MEAVREWIVNLSTIYDITALAFDRWMSHMVVPYLDGINCEPFGQGYASQSVPTKEMERLMCDGKIIHGGHDVLRWQFGCVQLARDEADNVKVTKKKNSESQKVDGVVSSIMALGIYLQTAQDVEPMLEIVTL
jgi:phage terminase large subunit-like protein